VVAYAAVSVRTGGRIRKKALVQPTNIQEKGGFPK